MRHVFSHRSISRVPNRFSARFAGEKVDDQSADNRDKPKERFRWLIENDVEHHPEGNREEKNWDDRISPDFVGSL